MAEVAIYAGPFKTNVVTDVNIWECANAFQVALFTRVDK